MQTRARGNWAENIALRYLRRHGLHLRQRQYDCRLNPDTDCSGELDLVMQWGRTLIFVEVRYRKHGQALRSVNAEKQALLRCCAEQYLQKQGLTHLRRRFDIVVIEGEGLDARIHWQKQAFPFKKRPHTPP